MSIVVHSFFLLAVIYMAQADVLPRIATAQVLPQNLLNNQLITGNVVFTETENGLHITGAVMGLPAGRYKLQIHQLGIIAACAGVGAQFDPAGDLGNTAFTEAVGGTVSIDIVDSVLTLRGENNVIGRSIVLHSEEATPGVGVACGVIGVSNPPEAWNFAAASTPSLLLLITAAFVAYLKH